MLSQAYDWRRKQRQILIVGTNVRARGFARLLESKPGHHILGFVDDAWEGLREALSELGSGVVTDLDNLDAYLREHPVDDVVVALPFSTFYQQISGIVSLCEEQGITVRCVPQLFDLQSAKARVRALGGEAVVTFETAALAPWQAAVKRALDLVVSAAVLLLLAPLLLVVAAAVKLTSPGPVFFVQQRVGRGKRRFPLFKFRTMVADAEQQLADMEHMNEVSGPVFKVRNDPRITPLGSFLRRSSIDELPQLLNVFFGHMSLVGPRPLPVRDVEGFDQDRHRRRFSVQPGITCLWQVLGRSAIPFKEWMELDLHYIDQASLWLDFKILLQTIPVVFAPLLAGSGGEFARPKRQQLAKILSFDPTRTAAVPCLVPARPAPAPRHAVPYRDIAASGVW